jgi:beta-1,4-N-acetylglucosaminyltransferase
MLSLLTDLDPYFYRHRSYVVSSGDNFSARKAIDFERYLTEKFPNTPESYDISYVPRARRIHQNLLTAPLSSLRCLFACLSVLRSPAPPSPSTAYTYPDLILTNGPATATILIFASLLLRFFSVPGTSGRMRTIYVESWARVKGLSLSGKILMAVGACERVLVQWEGLSRAGRGEFRGVLVR